MSDKYLIVGLGNPGRKYEGTRHNIGFDVVDEIAQRHNLTSWKTEHRALTADGIIHNKRVMLVKPQTYMNLSGESVRPLADYYRIEPERILFIYDDLDIPFGTLRLRKTGSHGGHNGMRNIIQHMSTRDLSRVRVGIGRPPGKKNTVNYVLNTFKGDDAILAKQVAETAAEAAEVWLTEGIDIAMSRYNGDIDSINDNNGEEPSAEDELSVTLRAHELAPDDPRPLEKLTRLYKKMRQYDKAVDAHLKLAEIYANSGKTRAQIAQYERIVAMQPERTELRAEIARLYEAQDDTQRAATSWLKLATQHAADNNTAAALKAVSEALRVNPQHPKAHEMRQELQDKLTL